MQKSNIQSRIHPMKLLMLMISAFLGAHGLVHAQQPTADLRKAAGMERGVCAFILSNAGPLAGLPADLARSNTLLVHVIATSDNAHKAALQAVAATKTEGLVSVERIGVKPLPYRDGLVNYLVVDDLAKASAAGFTKEDALRVVAPLGKLCILSNGKWEITPKAMPAEMDEWTHETRSPDGSLFSKDKVFRLPISYKWNAGLPMNFNDPKLSSNTWSSTRAIALSGGRCFTVAIAEIENLLGVNFQSYGQDQYLSCRDAFNGLLLWRKKLGKTFYGGLYYTNRAPLVAVGNRVYAASEDGKLLVIDAATGETIKALDTAFAPGKILVDGGLIVTANWAGGTSVGGLFGVDRRRHDFGVASGSVEAYDATSLKRVWKIDALATSIRSAHGMLYMVQREGPDKREEWIKKNDTEQQPERATQSVVAVDMTNGTKKWEVSSSVLGKDDYLILDSAGRDSVSIIHDSAGSTSLLSAKDGSVQTKTGKAHTEFNEDGTKSVLGLSMCTPNYQVNGIGLGNRGGFNAGFWGARGACLTGCTPAYGAIYIAQNWCNCVPGQIQGFISLAPVEDVPSLEELEKPPVVEKGPAYGVKRKVTASAADWPCFRKDAGRSGSAAGNAPAKLEVLWQAEVVRPVPDSLIATTWKEDLASSLTAPVSAGGTTVVATVKRNQIVGYDSATGKEKWRFSAGGGFDTAPSIMQGLCIAGSHDGYVVAIDCADGRLAWRFRMGPREQRMISYGKVESPWPVVGTVIEHDGIAYAVAGRSQGADGGCIMRAFNPGDGSIRWSKAITVQLADKRVTDNGLIRPIDMPFQVGGSIQAMLSRFDAKTGEPKPVYALELANHQRKTNEYKQAKDRIAAATDPAEKAKLEKKMPAEPAPLGAKEISLARNGTEGLMCWNWPKLGNRKFQTLSFGNLDGDSFAWNSRVMGTIDNSGRLISLVDATKVQAKGEPHDGKMFLWRKPLPANYLATSIIMFEDAVAVGGGIYDDKKNLQGGFIQILSPAKGEMVVERIFDTPLTFNGLAAAAGNLYATFDNGSLVCLGNGK